MSDSVLTQLRGTPYNRTYFEAPPGSKYAPRGYYMLFVVNDIRVPSVATWVFLQ